MASKMIAVTLPEKLIKTLNAEALINYESRSEYVKRAIIARLKADGIDITDEPRNREEVERKKLLDFLATIDSGAAYDTDVDDGDSGESPGQGL